jgi:hypothetical protein
VRPSQQPGGNAHSILGRPARYIHGVFVGVQVVESTNRCITAPHTNTHSGMCSSVASIASFSFSFHLQSVECNG